MWVERSWAKREVMTPAMLRQRGEFIRLVADVAAMGDGMAMEFAKRHYREIDSDAIADAYAALNWLRDFLDEWEALEGQAHRAPEGEAG